MIPVMDSFDFNNKTVIVRVDINSPLEPDSLKILDNWRIKKIIPTISELKDSNARQIIIAHQGRPGSWDFIDLDLHAKELSRLVGTHVEFVDDIYGKKAQMAIQKMNSGDIILLNNVRNCSEELEKKSPEEHSLAPMIKTLSKVADAFINDAFAAAHRKQCSLVGFIPVLPSFAGRLMQQEIDMVNTLLKTTKRPRHFIFGGGKYRGALEVIRKLLENRTADQVLVGGMPGNAIMAQNGLIDMEIDDTTRQLITQFSNKIIAPIDTVDQKDIGIETLALFKEKIAEAESIFISGPMGMFENEKYKRGTQEVLNAIAKSNKFSMAGGGHTAAAINRMKLEKEFSYVSTGGGALERMLVGETLPVIDALIRFKR
jgi:phosphoglycerate kinase